MVLELERYRERTGRYPATLQQLVGQPIPLRLLNIYDQTAGIFVFPRVYEYHLALPDSLLRGTGYRPVR